MDNFRWIIFSFLSLFSLIGNYLLNKGLSVNFSPFLAMSVTGVTQFVISGVLFLFSSEKISDFSSANLIMSVLVAICVLGIDYGMIAAYKYGGNSVVITLIVSMATVFMLPISYIFFKESISIPQFIGVLLSIVSLYLVIAFPVKG